MEKHREKQCVQEKIISGKKIGMPVLIGLIAALIGAFALLILGIINDESVWMIIVSIVYMSLGWIPFMGLKVVKPQEALVLALFGDYYGTLIGPGFYFVNPFFI